MFDFAPQSASEVELSSTQRDTSEPGAGGSTENSVSPRRSRSPSASSSGGEHDEIPFAETRPTDAFAKLMAADQRPLTKHQKQAKERIRSNLVDEQADESDEDNWLMPGQKNEDDEEEDEDDNAFLPELVDDQEVSEEDRMRQDALVAQKNRQVPCRRSLVSMLTNVGRSNLPTMPSEKLRLEKSPRGNTVPSVAERISTLMTRTDPQGRRGGPRNRCDRERSGKRMVLINLVCQ